jgi:hypothetical protein
MFQISVFRLLLAEAPSVLSRRRRATRGSIVKRAFRGALNSAALSQGRQRMLCRTASKNRPGSSAAAAAFRLRRSSPPFRHTERHDGAETASEVPSERSADAARGGCDDADADGRRLSSAPNAFGRQPYGAEVARQTDRGGEFDGRCAAEVRPSLRASSDRPTVLTDSAARRQSDARRTRVDHRRRSERRPLCG